MPERNPVPECLSHLDQLSRKPDPMDVLMQALEQAIAAVDLLMKGVVAPLKVCRDCKWCRYPGVAQSACIHDDAVRPTINPVTGTEHLPPLYCATMRLVGYPCGIEARLFEAREATDV